MPTEFPPNMKVYIVDDDDLDREVFARVCDEMGVASEQYPNPLAPLDDLDEDSSGCVLSDLRMPEMSGMELYRKTKGRGLRLATIIVTSFKSPMFEHQCMGSGLFAYCEKSECTDKLKDLIGSAMQFAAKPTRSPVLRY